MLQELGEQLPEVGLQVRLIREVYDRGRGKVRPIQRAQSHGPRLIESYFGATQAQELVKSLEWLNTPVPHRLRKIIFTPDAPVSGRWKASIVRRLFSSLSF